MTSGEYTVQTPAKALSLQQVIQVDIQMSFEEF